MRLLTLFCLLAVSLYAAEPHQEAASFVNAAGADIYGGIRQREGNQLFSPYSAITPLALVAEGARGETRTQMDDVLHLSEESVSQLGALHTHLSPHKDKKGWWQRMQKLFRRPHEENGNGTVELQSANSIWIDRDFPLEAKFRRIVKGYFGDIFISTDFESAPEQSRQAINTWVERQTRTRIQDLLPPGSIDSDTRMTLVNALYLKADWEQPFSGRMTRTEPWTRSDGTRGSCELMHQEGGFNIAFNPTYRVLELPYVKDRVQLAMRIYLPNDPLGLAAMEQALIEGGVITSEPRWEQRRSRIWIPKFKQEVTSDLGSYLIALGMQNAFRADADFQGISSERPLFISSVLQKTFIQVDEKGSEAAAATAVTMTTRSMVMPNTMTDFRADHSFLYTIVEKESGVILFLGRLDTP